jgi:cellulose synthase/poly-beta-1,6-N-acetylglucosamine synthase-like glycosyltransferase
VAAVLEKAMTYVWGLMTLFVLPLPFLAARAARCLRDLPELGMFSPRMSGPGSSPGPDWGTFSPPISIIIPARNEASNLGYLLPSLQALRYPGPFEVIVVDDNSSDRTAEVAREHGAILIPAPPLTPGWLGKPLACHTGAQSARFDWLLFTDADTLHHPDGPVRAVRYAQENDLDGLSLFLDERTYGLADKLAMTAAFAGLFAGLSPGRPLLNGQYILIRKEAYFRSGGFEAVRSETLEDLALAHRLAACGLRVPTIWSAGAAEVSMYTSFAHLWHGLSRLGSGSLKWSGPGGWLTALFITGTLTPILLLLLALLGLAPLALVLACWLVVCLSLWPWTRRSGSPAMVLGLPFGALLVQMAACWGLVSTWLGRGVRWKERLVH